MGQKEYEEFEPLDKIDEILELVKQFSEQAETVTYEECKCVEAVSPSGVKLFVEAEDEITLFFADWHAHYAPYAYNYELFISDLKGILNNERFAVCAYSEGVWACSFLSEESEPNREALREEVGSDKKIVCSFWDSSKNVTFESESK